MKNIAVALAQESAREAFIARRTARSTGDAALIAKAEADYTAAMTLRAAVEHAQSEREAATARAIEAERRIYEAEEAANPIPSPVNDEDEYEAYLATSAAEDDARRAEEEARFAALTPEQQAAEIAEDAARRDQSMADEDPEFEVYPEWRHERRMEHLHREAEDAEIDEAYAAAMMRAETPPRETPDRWFPRHPRD